ncbi:MAG: hypothetical protein NC489_36165 [Ruminococcus flavefaciens]|nr:hypothetical protein [Ruminococcus flavefaciens]
MDNLYWLEGKISISEDKRAELNANILKLLKQCGIRKLKEMQINGKNVIVVHEPVPDENGIVSFDYSVFEKRKREISYYNMNTCELHSVDRGYSEFGVVMNFVMTMLEAYSTGHCYLMFKNEVCSVSGYATVIEQMIGVKLSFPNREKIWDMFVFFKMNEKYSEMTYDEIWDHFPYGYAEVDIDQLIACFISTGKLTEKPKDYVPLKKSEIKHAKTAEIMYYAYELFQTLIAERGREDTKDFLKSILDLDISEREKIAQAEDVLGCIAEISLYELPAYLVSAYSKVTEEEFWAVWRSLEIMGYQDIYREDDKKEEIKEEEQTRGERLFYKGIQRDYEDEFLEFWDNQELCLSDGMRKNLEEWKRMYETADEAKAAEISVETSLADILLELQEIWECRYVDEKLIRDFLENRNVPEYKKAVLLFREILDEKLAYFPELTVNQTKEWVIKDLFASRDNIKPGAYASLLTNPMRRADLLGF